MEHYLLEFHSPIHSRIKKKDLINMAVMDANRSEPARKSNHTNGTYWDCLWVPLFRDVLDVQFHTRAFVA